jgi:hypothetical protein
MKDMEDRLQKLQQKIEQNGIGVSETLEKDILTIMGSQNLEATPHMKFFWQEQMKLLQSSKMGRRYHPQVILFALSIHSKSPSAYRELRESGALILPSERVLRAIKITLNRKLVSVKRMWKACVRKAHLFRQSRDMLQSSWMR